jgi:hypothetical protein
VLLRQNPLEDVARVAGIEAVIVRGRPFERSDLDRLLDDGRRALATLRALTAPASSRRTPPT